MSLEGLPICADCPSQLLRTQLESAQESDNPLDNAALQIASSMLTRRACGGLYVSYPTHTRGPVERCGNDAEASVCALFEQVGEISARFGIDPATAEV